MMGFQKKKAIIFDFDGTLAVLNIDFLSIRERIFQLINQYGVKEESLGEKYLLEIIDEVYQILLKNNSVEAKNFYANAHEILYELEIEGAHKGNLFPQTKETLKTLRDIGVKIGIVTRNCEEAVRIVFSNIDDFCDVFISRNSINKVKPHPEHLSRVINILGVSSEEALMVGDHIIDIQTGKALGMSTVGVLTGRTKREEFEKVGANYIMRDISEVLNFFKE